MQVKDLFVETKKVIAKYKAQAEELNIQEQELKDELVALQEEMTANILNQESANLSERIYLRAQGKEINSKVEIVNQMLEEIDDKRTELKLRYTPILQEAIALDRQSMTGLYDGTEIVKKYRHLMLTELAKLGEAMQSQYLSITPDVNEIFWDKTVREQFPRLDYVFYKDQYTPSLQWFNNAVVSKNEIFSAASGNLPSDLKKLKDVK